MAGSRPKGWAGHVCHAVVRRRLCKVYYLRIVAVRTADGESLLSTHPVAGPTHTVPDVDVGSGLTAVMGRMFTSGSNAQEPGFAKSRANVSIVGLPGPKLPFTQALDAVAQLPRSGHSTRCAAFCYAR